MTAAPPVKFHYSLWVADLGRTVAFYRALFGTAPAKDFPDYAKFELDRPPLVLSFLRRPAPRGASLNHVGLRLPDPAGLVEVQRRLEAAGHPTLRQDGVECCYALQTKFWATDPDGVRWEVYTLHGDIPHHGAGRVPAPAAAAPPAVEAAPAGGTWAHGAGDPFPARLPFPDGSLHEVQLLGTFNAGGDAAEWDRRLAEARRVLRPGGRVLVRGLVGDRPFPGTPDFPGLMARVRHVPLEREPLDALSRAGFASVEVETLKPVGCVEDTRGVGLGSLVATAVRPDPAGPAVAGVRYDGPFARATDDDGTAYPRGVVVRVPAAARDRLMTGPAAHQFTFPEG